MKFSTCLSVMLMATLVLGNVMKQKENIKQMNEVESGSKESETGEDSGKEPCQLTAGYLKYLAAKRKRAAAKVKSMYNAAKMVTPNMFGLTQEEASNFTNRMTMEIVINPPVQCNRNSLPKYTDCKVRELHEILNSSICNANSKPEKFEPRPLVPQKFQILPSSTAENSFRGTQDGRATRRRRATPGDVQRNSDGSVTTVRECFDRRTITVNGNLRLCRLCAATTVLPEDRFPRFINELICDGDQRSAFSGEGYCYQNYMRLQFRIDLNRVGIDRLGEWASYQQQINTFCSCQILTNSLFLAPLV